MGEGGGNFTPTPQNKPLKSPPRLGLSETSGSELFPKK